MAVGRPIPHLAAAMLLAFGVFDFAASATPHKPHRAPPTPAARDVEPETTATIPMKTPTTTALSHAPDAVPASGKTDEETLPTPFRLPTASHARMRDCGLKWQAMKMSGEAGDDIWRDFATSCLAAANGPLEQH